MGIDRTNSYIQAEGFYDAFGNLLTTIPSINNVTSALSGIAVTASVLNEVIPKLSGITVTADVLNEVIPKLSGIAVTADVLNEVIPTISGITVSASIINDVMSGLTSGISAEVLNNLSGLKASGRAYFLNNCIILASGTDHGRKLGCSEIGAISSPHVITSVTAFGMSAAMIVFATPVSITTAVSVNVSITGNTAITFYAYIGVGATSVTAGHNVYLNTMARGW